MLAVFDALRATLSSWEVKTLVYKVIPSFYHAVPAEEDLYALFRAGARLIRRDLSGTIRMEDRPPLSKGRRWATKAARAAGIDVGPSDDVEAFMALEEANLLARHGVRPVHSGAELRLLATRFPEHVKLFTARREGRLLAGTVIYETPRVAHAQYIAASDEGRSCGASDRLFDYLLGEVYATKPFFDFGISTENAGRDLNVGLAEYKESWGARATVYDQYEIDLTAAVSRPDQVDEGGHGSAGDGPVAPVA
jgi:hypothetical protein